VGVDLAPALRAHGTDPAEVVGQIDRACIRHRGLAPIPAARTISAVARVLSIGGRGAAGADAHHLSALSTARAL